MSVERVNMFTVICDNCGEDIGANQDYSCYNDDIRAEENAMESEWIKENGNHYCTECYSYNDDDELVIDEKRKAFIIETVESGIELIAKEQIRHFQEEGWTVEHDDQHTEGELANAAAVYALTKSALDIAHINVPEQLQPLFWPWEKAWYKPSPDNRVKELVKAGSLIAAEVDRLIRIQSNERSTKKN